MDPNGNTYVGQQPFELTFGANGVVDNFVPGTGHINATNVDTAIFNGMSRPTTSFRGLTPKASSPSLTLEWPSSWAPMRVGCSALMTASIGSATSSGSSSRM